MEVKNSRACLGVLESRIMVERSEEEDNDVRSTWFENLASMDLSECFDGNSFNIVQK